MNSSLNSSSSEVKARASKLREILADIDHKLKHTEALEVLSKFEGFADWNTYSAYLKQGDDIAESNPENKNPATSSGETNHSEKPDKNEILYCSFCGKSEREVLKLIAGPKAQICEGCTELCIEIVLEEMQQQSTELKAVPIISSLFRGLQREDDQPKSHE